MRLSTTRKKTNLPFSRHTPALLRSFAMDRRKTSVLASCLILLTCGLRASAQTLDGTWEITTVIDNGRVVEPTEVMLNYAADGRVVIRGQQVELLVPMTYQRKVLPFMIDGSKSPMTFDMAGAEKT